MEERIMMELDYRTGKLDENAKNGEDEIQADKFFQLTVGSIINRMLFGERFEKSQEDDFFNVRRVQNEAVAEFTFIDSLYNYPFLRNIPYFKHRWTDLLSFRSHLKVFLEKQIQQRISVIENGDHTIEAEPEDYVDAFLAKVKSADQNDATITLESLTINLSDLWGAGQGTSTTTLLIGFYHLVQNPEVVEKVRKELLSVTKGEHHLSLRDKAKTPYFNDVITEFHRMTSILAINLFRKSKEDTIVGGHPVTKGIPITNELSVLMNDDAQFKESNKFDPSRYLKNDKLDQHVQPFGMGKRACPGESLARAEMYLITGNFLLRYNMAPPASEPLMLGDYTFGFFRGTPKYKMRLTKISS